jgi:UbiD family decarboxylase
MTSFRDFIGKLDSEKKLLRIKKEVSTNLEIANIANSAGTKPVLFEKIKESGFRAVANVFPTRDSVCEYLGCSKEELIPKLIDAINNPTKPDQLNEVQWSMERSAVPSETGNWSLETGDSVDLSQLPIPIYLPADGGPYITAGIVVAKDPELGQNLSFHRMMVIDKDKLVLRILHRHLDEFIKRAGGDIEVAVIIGAPINVLLSAAISSTLGQNELEFANSLMPLKTVKLQNGIEIPADVEFAFTGKITKEMHDEGPFLDLTGTYDVVRKQQVMVVEKIYHQKDPIWHVLLPGGLEHKILMGMPREPTIFNEVNNVAKCTGVNITPGGCSWLHVVVAIDKQSEEDGKAAIEAAFKGHKSLKKAIIVDNDINIDEPAEVEWALATRFQASSDLIIKENEKGSSLDPSADPETYKTTKMGMDATAPLNGKEKFKNEEYGKVNLEDYQ